MSEIIAIGSERSEVGLPRAISILEDGGSAIDAVEGALRECEDNLADHYIGTGGLPNALGQVELDASIMVGSSRSSGAVGAVQNYPNPISIARAVMERLPQHCLLVGPGAERFAEECGFEKADLVTEEAWDMFKAALLPSDLSIEGEATRAVDGDELYRRSAIELANRFLPHDGPWGTINVIALDKYGEMCVGVSTSGYPWKYPGRVGDSAVVGAGNYCDLRYGGAACTGRGEMSMRVVGAKTIVGYLGDGLSPDNACLEMLKEANSLDDGFRAELRALALTPDGRYGAASVQPGATYAVIRSSASGVEILPRSHL